MNKNNDMTTGEVSRAGEPTQRTLDVLQAAGKEVTEEQIGAALAAVDKAQGDYASMAIMTGLILLKKKLSLKHGQWEPYLEKLAQKDERVRFAGNSRNDDSKTDTRVRFESVKRVTRRYVHLAQRFLADIEQRKISLKDGPAGKEFERSVDLDLLARGDADTVELVKTYVAGRSMRRLLLDLNDATKAAMEEELEEQRHQARLEGTEQPPAKPLSQMFFEIWEREKAKLSDNLFRRPDLEALSTREKAEYFEDMANDLRTKAALAENFAKANREKVA